MDGVCRIFVKVMGNSKADEAGMSSLMWFWRFMVPRPSYLEQAVRVISPALWCICPMPTGFH